MSLGFLAAEDDGPVKSKRGDVFFVELLEDFLLVEGR